MASRPSRRRGRLTEQQEAAAAELRALREGGGLRTEQHEARPRTAIGAAGSRHRCAAPAALHSADCPPAPHRSMTRRMCTRRWMSASSNPAPRATASRPTISLRTMVRAHRPDWIGPSGKMRARTAAVQRASATSTRRRTMTWKKKVRARSEAAQVSTAPLRPGPCRDVDSSAHACPVAGGKDAKKQKLGDGTLPQSMLSNYLRKGEQLPPSLPSWSCIISARALRPPSAERSDCCCQVRPSLRPNLPRRQKPQQRTSTKSN